jgi:serine/threonine protein kinase
VTARHASWDLPEGAEIVPGRHAVRLLGGGRRYEAYLAWDDDLRALVVAKVVRPDRVRHPGTLAGLAGEARALEALRHPSLVRSFDAVLDGPRPHLVLEHLDGPRLSTFIRREVASDEQILALTLELAAVVHHIGRRGWVHLDIKPRNVIMAGPPRLIDLSIARTVGEARRDAARDALGTAGYMAPEQRDRGRADEIGTPTDVWGLGACVYELIAKRPAGEDAPEALPARTPPLLAAMVMACLQDRPAERPTAAELGDALEPVVDALPRPRLGMFRPGGRRRGAAAP